MGYDMKWDKIEIVYKVSLIGIFKLINEYDHSLIWLEGGILNKWC